jgi:Tfp pilus assembly protein PilV
MNKNPIVNGWRSQSGFSLIEALVATTLVIVAVGGVAQLVAGAIAANGRARAATAATLLASSKIDHLLTVPWSDQVAAATASDASLDEDVPGYYDVLDAAGQPAPGAAGAFVRRWSVRTLQESPGNAVVLHVVVSATSAGHPGLVARMQTVRTRRLWWEPVR